ncbi:MAG TPA: outer membrane protein [Stellaceae bacterium]|nr:outer membrane protein [Stellaceae bacterium]
MNRLIAAFVGLLGICIALPATAQTAMPSMSAPWNWTGFYLGIQGGYGFGQADHIANFGPAILDVSGTFSADGGIVGVTGGYNHQFGHIVLGLDTDVSKTWLSGQTAGIPPAFCPTGGPTANCKSTLEWLVTARPRLGYAFGQFLPYIDGGLAVAGVRASGLHGAFSGSETKPGWAAGAGLEVAFSPHFSGKIEYLHIGLADQDGIYIVTPTRVNTTFQADLVRVGLNYRF